MVMGFLSPRGSQITTTTVAGAGNAMIMARERCLLVGVLLVMGLLSPHGSQITTTTVAGAGNAMIMTRERGLLVLELLFYFSFIQGIGSWLAAWASRVDVV